MAVSEPSVAENKKVLDTSERVIRLQENIISTLFEDEQSALALALMENSNEQMAEMDKQMEDNLQNAVVSCRPDPLCV